MTSTSVKGTPRAISTWPPEGEQATKGGAILRCLREGRVLTIFCEDVAQAAITLSEETEATDITPTLISLEWSSAPALTQELREIERALAEAVKSLWPNWHCSAHERFDAQRFPNARMESRLAEARKVSNQVSARWFREAWRKCRKGSLPLLEDTPSAEQVRQLTLALDPAHPIFALAVHSPTAAGARVRGLARACEWLAKQALAPVALLVPHAWRSHPELDPVNYGALEIRSEPAPPEAHVGLAGGERRSEGRRPRLTRAQGSEKIGKGTSPKVAVQPNPGKPRSEAEELLSSCLQRDVELNEVFALNQRVAGMNGQEFIVDLIDRVTGLVVEVDGEDHRRQHKFIGDRERDYQLFMNGHPTLRVTNEEVFFDAARVVEKIRRMLDVLKKRKEPK